jgi:predicted  nucleic acid-binding Zn-ribbon protein
MINQQTYKSNLETLSKLKSQKSKIEGNIETRNNQIEKINNEIDALKKRIKDEFNISAKDVKTTIAEKEQELNYKLAEITNKLEELETNNE